jgi:hypothetical protein
MPEVREKESINEIVERLLKTLPRKLLKPKNKKVNQGKIIKCL